MTAGSRFLAEVQPAPTRDVQSFSAAEAYCPACNYVASTYRRFVPAKCPRCHFDRMQWGRGPWRGQGQPNNKG